MGNAIVCRKKITKMNSAVQTSFQSHNEYCSCIKVDGRAILPPLMSQSVREEMRRWRQVAVSRKENLTTPRPKGDTPRPSSVSTLENHETPRPFSVSTLENHDHDTPRPSSVSTLENHDTPRPSSVSTLENHVTPRPSSVSILENHDTPRPFSISTLENHDHDTPRPSSVSTLENHNTPPSPSVCTLETTESDSVSSSVFESMGLSKLKTKMKTLPPSLFKVSANARSPLLKGVMFLKPLSKPRGIRKFPLEALNPAIKPKFDRISACAKGYLVRRLFKTEKVSILIQTIKESVKLIFKLYEEGSRDKGNYDGCVLPADFGLHACLVQQLNGACNAVREIFKLSTKDRMAIIATDRTKLKVKADRVAEAKMKPKKNIAIPSTSQRSMKRLRTSTRKY